MYYFLVSQHRSGSTFAALLLAQIYGAEVFPEEPNLIEPSYYRRSALSLIQKNAPLKKFRRLPSTYWNSVISETDVSELLAIYKNKRPTAISVLRELVSIEGLGQNRDIVFKYPVHVFYWRQLRAQPDARIFVLHRDLADVLLSKINDRSSTALSKKSKFKFILHRVFIDIQFFLENCYILTLGTCNLVTLIKYERLQDDDYIKSKFGVGPLILPEGGKATSKINGQYPKNLNRFERFLCGVQGGIYDYLYN